MNLIDCSFFHAGPLQVENAKPVDDLDNNAYAVQEAITAYIERYQGEFLSRMLGRALAKEVESYLAERGKDESYEDSRAEALCARLRLPFAHYVYFKMAGDMGQLMTVTGIQLMKSANTPQPPRQRMVRVWNDMVRLNAQFVEWASEQDGYDVYYDVSMTTPINQYNL
jgi:hypothetical protein